MKLAEFLNDDTCQIFLAIIIGIVVCYFIFGSCGTGGCSRRDGFSVGGQSCTGGMTQEGRLCEDLGETACLRNLVDCTWNPGSPAPTPPANSGQTQMERDCEAYLTTLSSDAESPCVGVTLGNAGEGGESGLDSTASCCDAVENTGGCIRDAIPPELLPLIDEEIAICNNPSTNPRQLTPPAPTPPANSLPHCNTATSQTDCCQGNFRTGCTIVGAGSANPKCDRDDKNFYCFDETNNRIIPFPGGPDADDSTSREACTNDGYSIYDPNQNDPNLDRCELSATSGPPLPTGNSLPSNNKYLNILSNMASAVLEIAESALAVSSTDDSRFLNEMMTNPDPTKSNFERVKSIAETNGIYFQILINGSQGRNFDLLNKFVRFIYPDKSYRRAQVFGNLFKTFSEAPTQVKKDLYCGQNSMFVKYSDNEFEKYDPLLKMKSANIMTHEYVNCDGDNTIFPTSSCPTDDISLLNNCDFHIRDPNNNLPPPSNFQSIAWEVDSVSSEFKRIMNNHSESDKYIEFVKNSYIQAADRRSAMQTVLRNPYEILIIDATSSYSIISGVNRLYMYVNSDIYIDVGLEDAKSRLYFVNDNAIDSSIDNFDSSQEQSSILEFEMKPSTISKLHKVYGMSQTGDGNIYKSNKGGEDPSLSDNKYNYFMNLLFIQYLITRIYLGTDNYLPFNLNIYDKQPANPLESDPDNREDIPSITGQNEEYTTNSLCARSGTDYLLLVYTEEDDKQDDEQDDEQVPAPLPAPLPACNNGGSRTLSIGDGAARNTWSSSLPQECIYAKDVDGRSERCANNCEGCYQVVNGVGHVCKDYSGKHDTRVCTVDYECQP
jgi:hypothetical protein